MRTYDEIAEDIRHAAGVNDAQALQTLATELEALGTPKAKASSWRAFGIAARITSDYALALEHFRHALSVFEELGDGAGVASATGNMGSVFNDTGDYASALEYYRNTIALCTELGDRHGVAIVTGNIGNVHRITGDYPSALEHYSRALAVHEELGDRAAVARVIGNIGNVYLSTGGYPSALEYYHRALALYEELGNRAGMALAAGNIGNVYLETGNYPSALELYHRSLALHEELGNRTRVAVATSNISTALFSTGDYSSALEHFERALALHEELGNHADVTLVTGNVLEALIRLDRFDDAASLLERQAKMRMDDPRVRVQHLSHSARLAEHRDDLDVAQRHLLEALTISTEAGLRVATADLHERLRDLAQKRNDFAGYIEHNKEYQRISEEVRGKEATQRMAMMEAERRAEAVERERNKERALLYGALPKSVADRMIRGEKITGDHFEHAAVLFIDVAAFTTHTEAMEPGDVVLLLEDLFSRMDKICDHHGAVKVKTIGDSYMCFRGDGTEAENALSIARVAADVAHTTFTWPDGTTLMVRMGAHIGPATAGVIGTQRLQYDVWGDTVNVASRMESHGEPGRIHVSEAFAAELNTSPPSPLSSMRGGTNIDVDEEWHLARRGDIDIKGKGTMTTYWLSRT